MKTTELPDLMTIDEVAAFLRVHHNTVRGYIARGRLPIIQVERRGAIRIRREDVLALLEPSGGDVA